MAITTDKKIEEMLRMNKADMTVKSEYGSLNLNHDLAKVDKRSKEMALNRAKKDWKWKTQRMYNTSLLRHPVKNLELIKT